MRFFVLLIVCAFVAQSWAEAQLSCYQCNPVTSECGLDNASVAKCGSNTLSKCIKIVRKGSSDVTKAMRKCVITDSNGQAFCPEDSNCQICGTELCNAGYITKFSWMSLVSAFVIFLYIC